MIAKAVVTKTAPPHTHTAPAEMLGQAHAEMLGQEGDVLEVVDEEEEIDGLVLALAVRGGSALLELMEAMADRWRLVKGRHHCALAAMAMGLKWLRERKQRVDEGGNVGGWLEVGGDTRSDA